ncbi:GPSM1 protein, partial [Polypterus senegalus]|nr:GPSM1 protein [Polypterus senegalus]
MSTVHLQHRAAGLSVAEKAMCQLVHLGPRPRSSLRPLRSELGLYVERIHSLRKNRKTLQLSRQLKDQVMEAQACYSLGNTYTLLQQYEKAVDYHLKHLCIAQELADRVGEGRACWSLGNAYVSLGNHRKALQFVRKHLEISCEIGDRNGELTARMNLEQLLAALGLSESDLSPCGSETEVQGARPKIPKRNSMDNVNLWNYSSEKVCIADLPEQFTTGTHNELAVSLPGEIKILKDENGDSHHLEESPSRTQCHLSGRIKSKGFDDSQPAEVKNWLDQRASPVGTNDIRVQVTPSTGALLKLLCFYQEDRLRLAVTLKWRSCRDPSDEECFFDLLSKFQSNRMDDQRCPLDEQQNGTEGASSNQVSPLEGGTVPSSLMTSPQTEEFFDLIATSQSRRLDDQRANVSNLPGLRITENNLGHLCGDTDAQEPSDEFFNMLMKCQSARIDDQRCSPPDPGPRAPTVPDEDFFSLIQRVQAKRMDEQRVHLALDESEDSPGEQDSSPPSSLS